MFKTAFRSIPRSLISKVNFGYVLSNVLESNLQIRKFSVHEFQAVKIFEDNGVGAPRGIVAGTPEEAFQAAKTLDKDGKGVVVKAQVYAGGRGKGTFDNGFKGGVKVASSAEEARDIASKMIGAKLITKQTGAAGKPCNKVFIAEKVKLTHEYYFAVLLDRASAGIVLVASREGGMDIEGVAKRDPNAIIKVPVSIEGGLTKETVEKLVSDLGFKAENKEKAVEIITRLYNLFVSTDATQVEINPLAETEDGRVLCMDAKLNFDDNAAFRHQDLKNLDDESQHDAREARAKQWDLNYVGLDGNIGCLVNGAGLAMATMDLIKLCGGEPANFLDLGGGANAKAIGEAFKIITQDPKVKAIFVNIFGGIVHCDVVAEGIVEAAKKLDMKVPIVARIKGTNVERGQQILRDSGIAIYPIDDLSQAAIKAVELSASQ
ncbi:Succinyl-CoA ligase [GDP-forming] subunit beta, hydrogenosomal [Zancudomyces culisetae]|uniref:Succinate--CoA ligase [ADP-forming] subunit beta, mitochondrial n=1 Tax=Zancudomyces culisetae TaxID=1213189 RepID=A0A1R1PYL8_ZANCU|nr:Succinyl-CoA ligase [GDP-forming] subunit beta, hydrogenosomal [Zancudomyces culisetae]|eukprot:OMH86060.1 Succinyl-CoA ligase [GDP-forming] subunit beta, hydrogenosomal [Zancudomyces culisetae]